MSCLCLIDCSSRLRSFAKCSHPCGPVGALGRVTAGVVAEAVVEAVVEVAGEAAVTGTVVDGAVVAVADALVDVDAVVVDIVYGLHKN